LNSVPVCQSGPKINGFPTIAKYSATPTSFVFLNDSPQGVIETVFTRQ
jgi:hypothetical protein